MSDFFKPVIARWPTVDGFATEVGCSRNVASEWKRQDSIPAPWFAAVVRAAIRRGFADITTDLLSHLAEQRRLARDAERRQDNETPAQDAAA